jgi:hypothetical protein
LHNFGAGDVALTQVRRAQYSQANFQVVEMQAQVAADVTAAAKVAAARRRALADAREAVSQAEEMWRRLERAAFGVAGPARRFDPLEPLLAEQALNQARLQYLDQVIEYNRAQFRLYWAMGQPPLCALPGAAALPVKVPAVPGEPRPAEVLPAPRPAGGRE